MNPRNFAKINFELNIKRHTTTTFKDLNIRKQKENKEGIIKSRKQKKSSTYSRNKLLNIKLKKFKIY